MSERIVLIFAYHFPPENSVGGRRPYRFCRYLQELGYRCHVITAADQSSVPESGAEYVPDPFLSSPGKGIGWQIERAIRKLFLPGMLGIQWSRLASDAAERFAKLHPDARITIFSTFPPLGAHLAAWRLSRRTGLPWIADFRDPLKFSPWLKGLRRSHTLASGWTENTILNSASLVVANTDAMVREWADASPSLASRIHLIWNGFDPERRIGPLPLPARSHRVYSHVGELYAGRNITPLLESIARLIDAGRLSASQLRIQLAGTVDVHAMPPEEFLKRAQSQGWLQVSPHEIPQAEANQMMQTSDGLLLIQPQSAIQVPGKLFDYIQIGRPILAYIPPDTPIERVLALSGIPYRCAFATSPQAEFDSVVENYFSLPSDAVTPAAAFDENFDCRHQTRTLAALIESLD